MSHESGIAVQIRNQEEGENQLIVRDIQRLFIDTGDPNNFFAAIDLPGFTQDHPCLRYHPAYGVDGIARLHGTADHLGQKRVKQHIGLIMNQRQLHIRVLPDQAFDFHGGMNSRHRTAHNHNIGCLVFRFWHGEMSCTVE